jgi:hypothetical protein
MQENMVVTGGKESRTYGILLNTGQISYECSMNECTNFQVFIVANFYVFVSREGKKCNISPFF